VCGLTKPAVNGQLRSRKENSISVSALTDKPHFLVQAVHQAINKCKTPTSFERRNKSGALKPVGGFVICCCKNSGYPE
jgi:hypothetical protein